MAILTAEEHPAVSAVAPGDWRTPALLLMVMAAAMQIAFAGWTSLMNNFAVEELGFTGRDIGIQQSVREIPGFLSFAAVFLLLWIREQRLAYISLLVLGGFVAATGWFPTFTGFLITTFISSVGFHYYETMHQSLTLQWLPKRTAPSTMGRIVAAAAMAQLAAYAIVFTCSAWLGFDYVATFMITGVITIAMVAAMWLLFPVFPEGRVQTKGLVLRRRYWLYYALTFMSGARRQIFVVFAAFMMVERFGLKVHEITVLFFVNGLLTLLIAPYIGDAIVRFGERKALMFEYIGLIAIFTSYAFVSVAWIAVGLYILDHVFFAFAIAMKTYFQKIADPGDIAPTTGVAFTINHIAAVFIPVLFGLLWLVSPAAVFLAGAAMAMVSLLLSLLVPRNPEPDVEFAWCERPAT